MVKREVVNCEINNTQKTATELIRLNLNHQIHYQGYCKLQINIVSQFLLVEPINENFIDIVGFNASFKWKFIKQKNILFVFGEDEDGVQDFALIFNNEKICRKVYIRIFKDRSKDFVTRKLLLKRFLNPCFKNVVKNDSSRMKEIFEEWIQRHAGNERDEYFRLLKWHKVNENDIKDVKPEMDQKPKNRKRRHHEVEAYRNNLSVTERVPKESIDDFHSDNYGVQNPSDAENHNSIERFTKIIDGSMFKIVSFKHKIQLSRKLLIFTSQEKTHCYEYQFYPQMQQQLFNHPCNTRRIGLKAILDRDENGEECIKMEDKKHFCTPILYEPEKYIEMKMVKKPNYVILENCGKKSKQWLIIFDSDDRSQCYEYFWCCEAKKFYCCGCFSARKKKIFAEIFHENTEIEYALLSSYEHICEKRKYNPGKYFSSHQFVTHQILKFKKNLEMELKGKF